VAERAAANLDPVAAVAEELSASVGETSRTVEQSTKVTRNAAVEAARADDGAA
jgi:hypothetical protein